MAYLVDFNKDKIVLNLLGNRVEDVSEGMNSVSEENELGFNVFPTNGGYSVGFEREVLDFEDGMVLDRNF